MLTAMISQPMNGKTVEEILSVKERAKAYLNAKGYEVINTYWPGESNPLDPVNLLGSAIMTMSKVDLVYFCSGWEDARGCRIEHDVAIEYDIAIEHEVI